ncbi:MAG TPA: hypothetical protein PKA10_13300 [Selenomonadales bacterium]|nr:hypothetical protein [Selenomonadales bacterium]
MSKDWKSPSSYTISPEEVERMLAADFGDRIQPVDKAMLAKQQAKAAHLKSLKK